MADNDKDKDFNATFYAQRAKQIANSVLDAKVQEALTRCRVEIEGAAAKGYFSISYGDSYNPSELSPLAEALRKRGFNVREETRSESDGYQTDRSYYLVISWSS